MKPSKSHAGARFDRRPQNEFGIHQTWAKSSSHLESRGNESGVRVAVIEKDAKERLTLTFILEEADDFDCSACFSNATEALAEIPRVRPDLVLIDMHLPDLDGIECAKRLKSMRPDLKIVMVSELCDSSSINESLEAGADHCLIKPIAVEQCLATLRCTAFGGTSTKLDPRDAPSTSSLPELSVSCPRLTSREIAVMKCLAQGFRYKEIEEELHLSHAVVKKLQHSAYVKLGASSSIEALNRLQTIL